MSTQRNDNFFFVGIPVTILSALLLGIVACNWGSDTSEDVTSDKRYWGGFRPNIEYILQQDLFIHSFTGTSGDLQRPLIPTVADYQKNPEKWPQLSILPEKSRIKVTKFEIHRTFENRELIIHSKPVDGRNKIIDLTIDAVCKLKDPKDATSPYIPDPQYLKEAGADIQDSVTTPAASP